MTRLSFAEVDCAVAQAAQQVGDKWTLLILRDAFNGVTRFDEFAEHLGVATNVLASRLEALVDAGVFYRRAVSGDGRAIEYKLAPKGFDLFPLIIFLNQWGERWMPKTRGSRLQVLDRASNRPLKPVQVLDADGESVTAHDTYCCAGEGGSEVMRRLETILARRRQPESSRLKRPV